MLAIQTLPYLATVATATMSARSNAREHAAAIMVPLPSPRQNRNPCCRKRRDFGGQILITFAGLRMLLGSRVRFSARMVSISAAFL